MTSRERILDDVARVAGGAVGVLSGARKAAGQTARIYAQDAAQRLDLVAREDYETLEALVHDLRKRVEDLEKKVKN